MYHSVKRLLLPLAAALCISGCSGGNVRMHVQETAYETDNVLVSIECPQFSIPHGQAYEDEINQQCIDEMDSCLREFEKISQTQHPEQEKCQLRTQARLTYGNNGLLSFYTERYVFTEGVHGSKTRSARTFDLNQKKQLTLADLFANESYRTLLNQLVAEILRKNPEDYHDLWENPVIGNLHETCFYLSEKGLVLYFPPYELSYYARGFVEFTIPYSSIASYLKPDYRILFD